MNYIYRIRYCGILSKKTFFYHSLTKTASSNFSTPFRNIKQIKPYRVKRPVKMRLEKVSRSRLPVQKPGVCVIDGRTYEVVGKDVESALNLL